MKTTDQASDRINLTKTPAARWYRVRPAIGGTLVLGVTAWLGLLAQPEIRDVLLAENLPMLARAVAFYGSALLKFAPALLNVLAFASVTAVVVAGLRTSRRVRRLRRKVARSFRFTQRLLPGSRTARA